MRFSKQCIEGRLALAIVRRPLETKHPMVQSAQALVEFTTEYLAELVEPPVYPYHVPCLKLVLCDEITQMAPQVIQALRRVFRVCRRLKILGGRLVDARHGDRDLVGSNGGLSNRRRDLLRAVSVGVDSLGQLADGFASAVDEV